MTQFDESFMSPGDPLKGSVFPGFGSSNRVPSTSRVERTAAKAVTPQRKVQKGLARSCVSVVREDRRTYKVFVKGSGALLGTVKLVGHGKSTAYTYKKAGDQRTHAGFPSQKAAVARMLEKS